MSVSLVGRVERFLRHRAPAGGKPDAFKMFLKNVGFRCAHIVPRRGNPTYELPNKDTLRIDAVIRNLEVIGEAASRIPQEVQERYPHLAWLEMRGMRNMIIHEYFGVSIPIIWQTISHDLGPLAEGMKRILEEQS